MFDKTIDWIHKHSNKSENKEKLKKYIFFSVLAGILAGGKTMYQKFVENKEQYLALENKQEGG